MGKKIEEGLFGDDYQQSAKDVLSERFIYPPFTVLNAREGWWQNRKRQWINIVGIKGEIGRGLYTQEGNAYGTSLGNSGDLNKRYALGKKVTDEAQDGDVVGGTSIFDPVLCELAYNWFCPKGGHILDPFAGESTKGIVATCLDYKYTGCELRPEQVAANNAQALAIGVKPTWVQGDSAKLDKVLPKGATYDMIWTSPPYYDLEVYSKSDKDGSAFATYDKFMEWYCDIFRQAVGRLKDNRFVAVKIGEVRDDKGAYYNFVGDNITVFKDALGLTYYNEAILITAVGSLPLRVNRQFGINRKLGKTHQNILVFYKGDMKKIKDEFPNLASNGN